MWQNAIFEVSHSENRGKSSLNGNDEIVSGKLELSKVGLLHSPKQVLLPLEPQTPFSAAAISQEHEEHIKSVL